MTNAPSINELKDLLRKKRGYAHGVIVAKVLDSSDLEESHLRVWRTDISEEVIIHAQRYNKDVWINLRIASSGELYVDSVNAERTAETLPDEQPVDANEWLAGNLIREQWNSMKQQHPAHVKRLALETVLMTALKMIQSPDWEQHIPKG